MGGFFGVVSKNDCVQDLFYGTDYHCHLGTRRGGLAVLNPEGFTRTIHDITNAQFRSKFDSEVTAMSGRKGIGVISDYEDQPLIIGSHLGTYAIVTVGVVKNAEELAKKTFSTRATHFSEMSGNEINPTELVATIINQEESFEAGIASALAAIDGSCSILILAQNGIYAARDRCGRTPVIIGKKQDAWSVTFESCAFPNLDYQIEHELGPGEIVLLNENGYEIKKAAGSDMQICSFLWIYYGFPASSYEGINVENARYRCGTALAKADAVKPDFAAGIPDSGIAHAIGYAIEAGVPYKRPFVKYNPTWARSFMPQVQSVRDLVARMKLIPVKELTYGARILFCDDSVVRGTQLRNTFEQLYEYGAREMHLRPACPPLLFGCKFLNFSRSRSEMDLAARKAIKEIEGDRQPDLAKYVDESTEEYRAMVDIIKRKMGITTLEYQKLPAMVDAIGLPREKLCTYCWDGCEGPCSAKRSKA
ncbi:MAG: amidophosphoribosyltransferase [Chitinispirillaceae bacterium]|nr:amidophosphoribosyltransferase [Chitinispirillaceae bacterium]